MIIMFKAGDVCGKMKPDEDAAVPTGNKIIFFLGQLNKPTNATVKCIIDQLTT
jgi:hypothetical protein